MYFIQIDKYLFFLIFFSVNKGVCDYSYIIRSGSKNNIISTLLLG